MNRADVVMLIFAVLSEKMARPHLEQFNEDARLNEHLCLDSVLVLELLVHLELEHGLSLPELAALEKQADTVGALADCLLGAR